MDRLAFDTETELLEDGCVAPRLVCMSLARPGAEPKLFSRKTAATMLRSYIDDPAKPLLVNHNVAFDFGVLATHDESLVNPIFRAYEEGRVRELMVREQLILIRNGRAIDDKNPHLADLTQQYLGHALDKGADSWRYRYGELMDVPLDRWPSEAVAYPKADARGALDVFDAQQAVPGNVPDAKWFDSTVSPDEVLQTRAAWVLHLMRMWGFRTDGAMVAHVKAHLEEECAIAEDRLLRIGLYKDTRSGKAIREGRPPALSKDMAKIQARVAGWYGARGESPPLTEGAAKVDAAQVAARIATGDASALKYVSTARDVLLTTDDADLQALAEVGPAQKALSTFIPLIEAGTRVPITPRWNVLVRSGRTSCGDSGNGEIGNWQNPAKRPGIREAVIARPGSVFISWDYSLAELCSLAQTCYEWFGASDMREAIIAGRDLHIQLACNSRTLLGHLSYEEAVRLKDEGDDLVDKRRQTAKNTNFGYPGGMGAATFVKNCWTTSRVRVSMEEATQLKADWLRTWREMPAYFDRIAREDAAGTPFIQPWSNRVRGFQIGDFCSRANSAFQGRTADGVKLGGWNLALECYVDEASPLFGFRPILMVHDQWVVEGPEERAHEAALRGRDVLKASMEVVTPDVPATLDFALMRRWYKKAKAVKDKSGRLVPWEPSCMKEVAPRKRCGVQVGPLDKYCPEHRAK